MMHFLIYFHQFVMKKNLLKVFLEKKIVYVDIGTNEGSFLEYLLKFCIFKKYFVMSLF